MPAPRYRDYADRAELIICSDCSDRTTLVVIDRDEIPEHDIHHEMLARAAELMAAWKAALAIVNEDGTPQQDAVEQTAYDALIDYVEQNGLNESKFDPR